MNDAVEMQNKARFAELLQENQSRIFSFIHSIVRDLDDADDLFQQTSVVLWRQFEKYDQTRSFLAWACGVARLEISNFLRLRSRKRLYFSDELTLLLIDANAAIENDIFDERREALNGCVQKLRPRDRELLEECYSGGADGVSDVAERRGRIPQSVHNSLRRIRRSLFECIDRTLTQTPERRAQA